MSGRLAGTLVAAGALLGACQAQAPNAPAAAPPYRVVHAGSACGSEAAAVHPIADDREFKSMATSPVLGTTPPASPDFERTVVLRLSMGQQPTAGAQFGVTGVRADTAARQLIVDTVWNPPAPGRMHAMVITRPCVIVAIDAEPGRYRSVQVLDARGEARATVTLAATR